MLRTFRALSFVVLLAVPQISRADVRLAGIFGNHMVIQQGEPVRVFGWAEPGEQVSVSFAGQTGVTNAQKNGRWRVNLPAVKADGETHSIVVKGKNTVEIQDVLIGEVWICSGQSNMEWTVSRSLNPKEEAAAANHPKIRLFNVPRHISAGTPNDDTPGKWQVCSPRSVPGFSAVGYFFGRKLSQETHLPIGLVGTNWGGTRIEPWTPPVGFERAGLKDISKKLKQLDPSTREGKDYLQSHLDSVEKWVAGARKRVEAGQALGNPPGRMNHGSIGGATTIYNGMVHGLAPFSVKGAVWYQGESNAGDGVRYAAKKRALVEGWRVVFENDDLSFYWVSLANFRQPTDNPAGGGWGPVRDGQRLALSIPNTGMALAIDIGDARDIHPRNKQDVGLRLARWALRDHYGQKNLVPCGPLFTKATVEGQTIRVSFDHVGKGLMVGKKTAGLDPAKEVAGGKLRRFAISGKNGEWKWAEAKIDGETVVVWSKDVPEPVAVRYGYESNPVGANLYNRDGLPASPFSSDNK
ncbi:MAG: sialate O-acetylesterase [Planctomycetota bacterium]